MKDYLVYHNPDVMGVLGPADSPFHVVTDKKVGDVRGNRVWLITAEGHPRTFFLHSHFIVDEIEPGSDAGYTTRLSGNAGSAFDPMIELNREDWFSDFKRSQGHFGFGFQAIKNSRFIKGLEAAAGLVPHSPPTFGLREPMLGLSPLIDRDEIARAIETVRLNLLRSANTFRRKVGWHGGGGDFSVHWNEAGQFWFLIDSKREESRYWCCFGLSDPSKHDNLTIIGEINPTKEGINRRNAGLFVRDSIGEIYLAHSGKIGGGRKGIGKEGFLSAFRGSNLVNTFWPDGQTSEAIVLGPIQSERLPAYVGHFIREIERYKDEAIRGETIVTQPLNVLGFTPEFSGQRKSYRLEVEISARCDHGVVIAALADLLANARADVANDRTRDLMILSSEGKVTHLFEVKTDINTSSLYSAVGQLMLHSVLTANTPRLILVLPDQPIPSFLKALKALGIHVVRYEWFNGRPIFHNFSKINA